MRLGLWLLLNLQCLEDWPGVEQAGSQSLRLSEWVMGGSHLGSLGVTSLTRLNTVSNNTNCPPSQTKKTGLLIVSILSLSACTLSLRKSSCVYLQNASLILSLPPFSLTFYSGTSQHSLSLGCPSCSTNSCSYPISHSPHVIKLFKNVIEPTLLVFRNYIIEGVNILTALFIKT